MFALELEIRLPVIKPLFIQQNNPGIAALVIRMALPAYPFLQAAVIAGSHPYVPGHRLVAIHTKTRLRIAIKAHMAVGTFGFKIRVTLDHLAGHDRGLKTL